MMGGMGSSSSASGSSSGSSASGNDPEKTAEMHTEVVRTLWDRVLRYEEAIGTRMYNLLFDEHPEYRQLFDDDNSAMPLKLMSMLGKMMARGSFAAMRLVFSSLGQMHAQRNVPTDAFPTFTSVLLVAIEQEFNAHGESLSSRERRSYETIASTLSHEIILNMKAFTALQMEPLQFAPTEDHTYAKTPAEVGGAKIGTQASTHTPGVEIKHMTVSRALEIFQDVWTKKIDVGDSTRHEIGCKFYAIFLSSNPQYRPLFARGVDNQADIFMNMMFMLSKQGLTEFSSKYERIIARHLGHGLDRTAFTKFGKAMIVAMKDVLASKGRGFTGEEVNAMRKIYTLLSVPMVRAVEAEKLAALSKRAPAVRAQARLRARKQAEKAGVSHQEPRENDLVVNALKRGVEPASFGGSDHSSSPRQHQSGGGGDDADGHHSPRVHNVSNVHSSAVDPRTLSVLRRQQERQQELKESNHSHAHANARRRSLSGSRSSLPGTRGFGSRKNSLDHLRSRSGSWHEQPPAHTRAGSGSSTTMASASASASSTTSTQHTRKDTGSDLDQQIRHV